MTATQGSSKGDLDNTHKDRAAENSVTSQTYLVERWIKFFPPCTIGPHPINSDICSLKRLDHKMIEKLQEKLTCIITPSLAQQDIVTQAVV